MQGVQDCLLELVVAEFYCCYLEVWQEEANYLPGCVVNFVVF